MKARSLLVLLCCLLLAGCASQRRMAEVRNFAAESAKLTAYVDLSQRFRDTYQRELPYLPPAAEQRERETDRQRQQMYPDLLAIEGNVVLYLRTLGQLAGAEQFSAAPPLQQLSGQIQAWPDSGLNPQHVQAYTRLATAIARFAGGQRQQQAVWELLRDGYQPLQDSLAAMATVLRLYGKHHENEQRLVLGMLEMEIPFAAAPQERLLAALAKAHQQEKAREYRLIGLRQAQAAQQIEALRQQHAALYQRLGAAAAPPSASAAALPLSALNR
ncbi:hypothetical protein [Massilia sp. erpn]|uniref:hypothetical protein n=1 Tax=Massilia sp. erpn TaxID=2738142 RepID=UPI002102EFF9|nr:hypothetical protein [Massilia sp. erpn]UTY60348.1 hypothetical protein HPQ68_26050 [Massilia sp. erpn]